jgi:hypothetical protein
MVGMQFRGGSLQYLYAIETNRKSRRRVLRSLGTGRGVIFTPIVRLRSSNRDWLAFCVKVGPGLATVAGNLDLGTAVTISNIPLAHDLGWLAESQPSPVDFGIVRGVECDRHSVRRQIRSRRGRGSLQLHRPRLKAA